MRLIVRRLDPSELNYELIWLSVSIGSLACAAAWLGLGLPWPICAFHSLTGYPCATCGATRSAIEFFHGHFLNAWRWNPLAFVSYCALSIFNVYAAIILVTRAPRLRLIDVTSTGKNLVRLFVIASLALNWIYLLIANP